MHIQRLRVLNYKSFRDSGFIEFGPSFNVIVGQNNSGKTALLEALGLHMGENKPHRRGAVPADHPFDQHSHFEFSLTATGVELVDALVRKEGIGYRERLEQMKNGSVSANETKVGIVSCDLTTNRGGDWQVRGDGTHYPPLFLTAFGRFASQDEAISGAQVFHVFSDPARSQLTSTLWHGFSPRIYAFKAERLNVSAYHLAMESVLQPNASNLPAVLADLFNKKPDMTRRFNQAVSQVLPSIQLVQSRNIGNQYRIFIQNRGIDPDRDDLSYSLEDCGAGVGQVLAILYVAMTMPPSVIIIDEPNSFLHPGAAKKLLQILASYEHQYIISTHSTDIISSVEPTTLHLVQWADGESMVTPLDIGDLADLRLVLSEVGIGLSDVFAADRIIWVEGKTEEICFPLLVKARNSKMPIGTSFLGLRNTGDLDSKKTDAQKVLHLYTKLGEANGIMPSALAYSLDKELRSEREVADLRRQFQGKLHFLPRRCFENYLLDPEAITAVLSELTSDGFAISCASVQGWLTQNGGTFHPDRSGFDDADFVLKVDAARLLSSLFSALSQTTVSFDKVRHSVALTKWLLEHKPAALDELTAYVIELLGTPAAS
jgi:ABC-type ATPase involved in cell division